MNILMNSIAKFRSAYPYGTIKVKAEAVNETHIRVTASIHTGNLSSEEAGATLVDIDSIGPLSQYSALKEQCIEEAFAFAGFTSVSSDSQEGEPGTNFGVAAGAGRKRRKKNPPEPRESSADVAPHAGEDIVVEDEAPADAESPAEEVPHMEEKIPDVESSLPGHTDDSVAEGAPVEVEPSADEEAPAEEEASTEETHVEPQPEESPLPTHEEEAKTVESSKTEPAGNDMSYEEASKVILVVNDPIKAKAMKEFIGKPLYLINSSRPTLLRFLVRASDRGEDLVPKECADAARILMAAGR